MRVKVCGIAQLEQLPAITKAGAAFTGFIFYAPSPRYVLKNHTHEQLKQQKEINKVGVFVNTPPDEVLQMVDACGLHMVQLHGDETPRQCEKIANYVNVIKAFRIGAGNRLEMLMRDYVDVCDMYLFDTDGAGYGGTGKKFNWEVLNEVRINKPFMLSGGIGPDDVEAVKAFAATPAAQRLFALDINSKFETAPGIKDIDKVSAFIQAVSG